MEIKIKFSDLQLIKSLIKLYNHNMPNAETGNRPISDLCSLSSTSSSILSSVGVITLKKRAIRQ